MLIYAKKYLLEIVVFVCGAAVMVLELAATRVLAPYVGTSLYVWTNLIGVILGCLSIGYWWGGRLADKRPGFGPLTAVIFISGIMVGATAVFKDIVMIIVQATIRDIRVASLLGTIVLFAAPSVLLGMVAPMAAKIRLERLDTSGRAVGTLYSISTVGSIAGTFLAGFFLIPALGNGNILYLIAGGLVALSAIAGPISLMRHRVTILVFVGVAASAAFFFRSTMASLGTYDIDTPYARVFVFRGTDTATGRPAQYLIVSPGQVESAMFLDRDDDLVLSYAKFYLLAHHFNPDAKTALMLGGAAYSYPKYFLQKNPEASIDVVEIDPGITKIAQDLFHLEESPRLGITHEDARIFLNKNTKKYDIIFGDAFKSSHSIPHHLTTRETFLRIAASLSDNGVVLVNIISSLEGPSGKLFRAEYRTIKSVFPHVFAFPVEDPNDGEKVQNIIIAAVKTEKEPLLSSDDPELQPYFLHRWTGAVAEDMPILTDEWAPVDNYIAETFLDK